MKGVLAGHTMIHQKRLYINKLPAHILMSASSTSRFKTFSLKKQWHEALKKGKSAARPPFNLINTQKPESRPGRRAEQSYEQNRDAYLLDKDVTSKPTDDDSLDVNIYIF